MGIWETWTQAAWRPWAIPDLQCVTAARFKQSAFGPMPWCETEQASRELMGKVLVSMQKRCFPTTCVSFPKQKMIFLQLAGGDGGSCLWLKGLIQGFRQPLVPSRCPLAEGITPLAHLSPTWATRAGKSCQG